MCTIFSVVQTGVQLFNKKKNECLLSGCVLWLCRAHKNNCVVDRQQAAPSTRLPTNEWKQQLTFTHSLLRYVKIIVQSYSERRTVFTSIVLWTTFHQSLILLVPQHKQRASVFFFLHHSYGALVSLESNPLSLPISLHKFVVICFPIKLGAVACEEEYIILRTNRVTQQ